MNKTPIERNFILKAKSLADIAASAEASITDRITYIVNTIVDAWEYKLDTWYFDGAQESEIGDLWSHYDEDEIRPLILIQQPYDGSRLLFYDRNGDDWDLKDSFPSRWLFEEFEFELNAGKNKWEFLERERKEKRKSLSKEKKALAEKAKRKLTKEELAVLKKLTKEELTALQSVL
jgi:hypothetical protein